MSVKYNSRGSQYTPQRNAWNPNKFMKEYTQVNDPFYPFVYGNPDGYGTNTNSDPFFWGQPQAPKYCGCGRSLKLTQTAEGFCDSCASGGSNYQDRDPVPHVATQGANQESTHQSSINSSSIKALGKQLGSVPDEGDGLSIIADEQARQLTNNRTVFHTKLANECVGKNCQTRFSENYTAGLPYGTVRGYGTGSVGNGTIPNAPVVPISYYEGFSDCGTQIGQYPPVAINSGGGIDYMDESLAQQAARTPLNQRRSYCEATNGGKKLR